MTTDGSSHVAPDVQRRARRIAGGAILIGLALTASGLAMWSVTAALILSGLFLLALGVLFFVGEGFTR
jgi:hypothetical protein